MTTTLDWARSVKPSMIEFQQQTGIPALGAITQFCHESAGAINGLSELAAKAHNYGGLKWASWQAQYGCKPVVYGTWEEIGGQDQRMDAAFCGCPDGLGQWLKVYAHLISHVYPDALRYSSDPMLYLATVWAGGYATDSQYLRKCANWMRDLWADYADTVPIPPWKRVDVVTGSGRPLSTGYLAAASTTLVPLRAHEESKGLEVGYRNGVATVDWPGAKR